MNHPVSSCVFCCRTTDWSCLCYFATCLDLWVELYSLCGMDSLWLWCLPGLIRRRHLKLSSKLGKGKCVFHKIKSIEIKCAFTLDSRITSTKFPLFSMTTSSASHTKLTALLLWSHERSYCISRPILAPPPLWLRNTLIYAHSPDLWHQPRLPTLSCAWS